MNAADFNELIEDEKGTLLRVRATRQSRQYGGPARDLDFHLFEIRPRKDHRGVDLVSNALPFGRLWYTGPNAISNAIGFARFYGKGHDLVIRVYDEVGNVIDRHAQGASDFRES
jgi:hypothetical protein